MLRAVLVVAFLSATSFADSGWIEIQSPNFVVRTDAGDKRGRQVAVRFEQMRKIYQILLPRRLKATAPLMVIAFKNAAEMKQVSPLWKGKPVEMAGLYLKGEDENFIVVDASTENAWQTVFHEYAHYMLNTNFPPSPAWWDEGFADYYSTVKVTKKEFSVGDPPDGYAELLSEGMMPMEQLLSASHDSSEYNENGHGRTQFYAQSWLLVYYIFENKLQEQTSKYFDLTMNHGESPASAVQKAYGKTLKEIDDDLKKFLKSDRGNAYSFPVPLGIEGETFAKRSLPEITVKATIADLHLHSRDHQNQAEQEFKDILKELPESSDAHRGIGYVLLRRGNLDGAAWEFEQAAQLGSKDPHVYYFAAYSMFKRAGSDRAQLIRMGAFLDEAMRLDTSYAEAYNLKAMVVARASNAAEAIRLLRKAVELAPRSDEYKLNLAYQLTNDRKFDEAESLLHRLEQSSDQAVAESAKKQLATIQVWKKNPYLQTAEQSKDRYVSQQWSRKEGDPEDKEADQLQSAQKEESEDTDKRPIKFAKGTLLSSQCTDTGSATLKAKVGTKTLTLRSPNYKKILMVNGDKFDCTWKNRAVAINYREISPAEGDLFSIEVK